MHRHTEDVLAEKGFPTTEPKNRFCTFRQRVDTVHCLFGRRILLRECRCGIHPAALDTLEVATRGLHPEDQPDVISWRDLTDKCMSCRLARRTRKCSRADSPSNVADRAIRGWNALNHWHLFL